MACAFNISGVASYIVAFGDEGSSVAQELAFRDDDYKNFDQKLIVQHLGQNGKGRVQLFLSFCLGWNGQDSPVASLRSLRHLEMFLRYAHFPLRQKRPSVFLTDCGNFELVWRGDDDKKRVIEFTSAGADFFDESTEIENSVMPADFAVFAHQICQYEHE